ncbi:MAG TPA: valine--tRNA ligase [Gammaproteobacteria bacterium]|nr:valine--tRNA ligase [Gammaproteobacteria bacterium]
MDDNKIYNPSILESEWYPFWERSGYFSPSGTGTPYCIMLPPPNVTGSLHMGHAFQQTLMDILTRYHRMKGRKTLWQVGTDHAGIATQMVVERQLLATGQTKYALGRDEFVNRVWQWKAESGGNISRQLRRIGASGDWSEERFTLDEGMSKAVSDVFIQLYKEGLIYRGKRLVNWDPVLKTAVSDLEVENQEEQGSLWTIRYPFAKNPDADAAVTREGSDFICVATTRPETLLGDVAVAVNPKDARFTHLIGKYLQLPLTDRVIPIIADDMVDPDFGTGCVKITPAHDFNDNAMGQRHNLPLINIFTIDATLNENAPVQYQGLDRFIAREKIIADLGALNLLEKIEPHLLKIPRGDRSNAVLEPLLTDQWFVSIKSLAEPAIEAVKNGEIRFVPDNWTKTYFEWMNNIQDWCISRQVWWGHRIPAWYDDAGKIYVGKSEAAVRAHYKLSLDLALKQDEDVLDTWFSSALWPFSTLGWPENTERLQTFYPTQVLVTGFDIIFFWVARMIMFGLKFTGKIPFHEIYIHGLIQDQNGQKMSKTKGNVIDPIDLIDGIDLESLVKKRVTGLMQPQLASEIEAHTRTQFPNGISAYGTDALRFTYAALATHGRHIRFDLRKIESNRHFCNKLWNAARFVLMNTEGKMEVLSAAPPLSLSAINNLSPVDQWILSHWQHTKALIEQYLAEYRFDLAAQVIYEFTWNEYCDWYLELTKPILNPRSENPNPHEHNDVLMKGTRHTLISVLEELLRVIHPFMPYITEALWQRVAPIAGKSGDTIMLQPYPEFVEALVNTNVENDINCIKEIVMQIRETRSGLGLPPSKPLSIVSCHGSKEYKNCIDSDFYQLILKSIAKVETIHWVPNEKLEESVTPLAKYFSTTISLAGLDISAELTRLKKEIAKSQADLEKINIKLSNPGFLAKAPADVVAAEQKRATDLKALMDNLTGRLLALS